jgi:sporulation protein YlmC with PRC-barrel domain
MIAPLSLSECLRTPVRDPAGRRVGRLADLEAEPGGRFPRVSALLLRRGRSVARVAWESVERFGPGAIVLRDEVAPAASGGRRLLLARDVLDGQVVDLAGKRLARVGDVELAIQDETLRAIAVDVGLAPVARRLGLRRLAGRLREEPIGWDGIYLASGPGHRLQLEHRAADVHRLSHEELMALVARLPPARGAEVLHVSRPGVHEDPVATARRAGPPRRRFRVMRARKRAPS